MSTCPTCGQPLRTAPEAAVSRALPTPERWQVEVGPRSLTARWRWLTWSALFLVPFTLFWNGIMVTMAAGVTEGFTHPERLLLGLAVPHVWVGIGLAYVTLGNFVNSTRVTVQDGRLRVRKGPLPWAGQRDLAGPDVKQLFVVEKPTRRSVTYELCALLLDGKRKSVLGGLEQHEARFLELRCEQALGIVDMPIEGEVRRG
jgi:hypothetical protein